MSKRRKKLTPEQTARLAKLRAQLSAPSAENLLPRLAKEASARLRAAQLPATFEELFTVEEYSDEKSSGWQLAYARITDDRTIPEALRSSAHIVMRAHTLLGLTSGPDATAKAARDTFWNATFLFLNLLAVTLEDDPLRKTGARTRKAIATANATKTRQATADRTRIREAYRAAKAAYPRRNHGGLCSVVTEQTRFSDRKIRAAVADLGPRNRKK